MKQMVAWKELKNIVTMGRSTYFRYNNSEEANA
jgi:hypothetical protein